MTRIYVCLGLLFSWSFLFSPCLRVSAFPRLRVHPSPRLPASLRSLIEREATFTIKVIKIFRLDEIETGARHTLKQRHDLIV